jgi:hypothetical protein
MASSTRKRDTPRPANDPGRWSRVKGGLNIRREPEPKGLQKALGKLPFGSKLAKRFAKRR